MGRRGSLDVDSLALDYLEDSTTTAGYIYYGEAAPGTAASAAGWRIARENTATGAMGWASNGADNQVWDNRASLTYSRS